MPTPISFSDAKMRLSKQYPKLILRAFGGVSKPCTIYCKTHKIEHSYAAYILVKGCPECAKEKWRTNRKPKTTLEYKKQVKKGSKGRITVLGEYVNCRTKLLHKCLICNYEWNTTPVSMLQRFACRACGHEKGQRTASKYREHVLGRRVVKVQGCEQEALNFITKKLGCDPRNVVVGSEMRVPTVMYKFNNKDCMYRPDFYVTHKNRLVEVKSTWYFGLTNKDYYVRLVAKAKACIEKGYDFRVIIANLKYSEPILLPKDWFKMTHKQFQKYWVSTYNLKLNGCRV